MNLLHSARRQDGLAACEELCLKAGSKRMLFLACTVAAISCVAVDLSLNCVMANLCASQRKYESSPLQMEQAFSIMAQLSLEHPSSQFTKKVLPVQLHCQ